MNVPGAPDQVDIEVKVVERPTGNLLFGVGYSTAEKIILSASVSQNNLFGTGNALSLQVNSGSVNTVYALSFTNPYFTDDGVSLGADLYKRNVDATNLNSVTPYTTTTLGTGLRLGVPITEYDTINYGLAVERTDVQTFLGSPPQYVQFVDEFGNSNTALDRDGRLVARRSRQHDLHDQRYAPTPELRSRGAAGGAALLSRHVSDRPVDSNRAGEHSAAQRSDRLRRTAMTSAAAVLQELLSRRHRLGARLLDELDRTQGLAGNALGGPTMTAVNAEYYFPFPGLQKDKSVRLSAFVDSGQVSDNFDFALKPASRPAWR